MHKKNVFNSHSVSLFFSLFLSVSGTIRANSILEFYRTSLPHYLSNVWDFDLIKILSQCAIKEILALTHQRLTGNHHRDAQKETGSAAPLWDVKIAEGHTLWGPYFDTKALK